MSDHPLKPAEAGITLERPRVALGTFPSPQKYGMLPEALWRDSIFDDCPDSLLRWFTCACAEQGFRYAENTYHMEVDSRLERLLLSYRWWIIGKTTDKTMKAVRRREIKTRSNIAVRKLGSTYGSVNHIQHRLADLVKNALLGDSTWHAAVLTAIAQRNLLLESGDAARAWQVYEMNYLKKVWAACGERSAWLLFEGKCPIARP